MSHIWFGILNSQSQHCTHTHSLICMKTKKLFYFWFCIDLFICFTFFFFVWQFLHLGHVNRPNSTFNFSESQNRPSQPHKQKKNRRGSSHDVRDQSPEHGTMGRKQRLVLFVFCCCWWCELYYFCMCNPECYLKVHKSMENACHTFARTTHGQFDQNLKKKNTRIYLNQLLSGHNQFSQSRQQIESIFFQPLHFDPMPFIQKQMIKWNIYEGYSRSGLCRPLLSWWFCLNVIFSHVKMHRSTRITSG